MKVKSLPTWTGCGDATEFSDPDGKIRDEAGLAGSVDDGGRGVTDGLLPRITALKGDK
jgi:hypothetical protein